MKPTSTIEDNIKTMYSSVSCQGRLSDEVHGGNVCRQPLVQKKVTMFSSSSARWFVYTYTYILFIYIYKNIRYVSKGKPNEPIPRKDTYIYIYINVCGCFASLSEPL